MNSDFSSGDSTSESARRLSAQRSIDLRNRNLLAATESNTKFMGWPITSQRDVLGGSVMYSLDEFFSKPTAVIDVIHTKFCNDFVFKTFILMAGFFLLSYSLPQKITRKDS